MKTKPRLGRGLSSLLSMDVPEQAAAPIPAIPNSAAPPVAAPPAAPTAPTSGSVLELKLDQVVPNPHQPRRAMNEATIMELAASIRSTGLIQPIVVRPAGDRFELIAGERRWRAARAAGLETIRAIIRESSAFEQAQMALIENIQRENLNPIDRALAYKSLMTQLGLTQAELASRLGEERSSIANYLRLLDLQPAVQTMVANGELSLGHAKVLAGVSDPADQERLAKIVVSQSLSVRNLERQIQGAAASSTPARAVPAASAHYQELEKNLSRELGLRVQLRPAAKKGKGRLILHYGSLDQFDQLVNKLGVNVVVE